MGKEKNIYIHTYNIYIYIYIYIIEQDSTIKRISWQHGSSWSALC